MYVNVERLKENNRKLVIRPVIQRIKRVGHIDGSFNNRLATITHRSPKKLEPVSTPTHNYQQLTIQRAVPDSQVLEKPIPETGTYQARGGYNVIFDKNIHSRDRFHFGSKTRNEVFTNFNPQFVGNRIVNVRASNGEQMNVEAVQLDHRTSWDTISNTMHEHNLKNQHNDTWKYSLWDAKMYYNDQTNLHPAPAGLNAAAGAMGVDRVESLHYGLESVAGELQTAWMNLQQTLSAMSSSIGEHAVEPLWERLDSIKQSMNNLSSDIANTDW